MGANARRIDRVDQYHGKRGGSGGSCCTCAGEARAISKEACRIQWTSINFFFKDFAGPIATAMAALSAAFVAAVFSYKQAKAAELQASVALDRLKFDTFEHRHDVLDACRDLSHLFDERHPLQIVDVSEVSDCALRIGKGKFYFGKAVTDELEEFCKNAADLARIQFNGHHAAKGSLERNTAEEKAIDGVRMLKKRLLSVQNSLEFDLSLNFLKAGSSRERKRGGLGNSSIRWPFPN